MEILKNVKTMPNNQQAEQAVLGSILLDYSSERCQIPLNQLIASDFYNPAHRQTFETMQTLMLQGKPIDLLTVSDHLKADGVAAFGLGYLAEMQKNTPSALNVKAYSAIVKNLSLERQTMRTLTDALAVFVENPSLATATKIAEVQRLITQVSMRGSEDKGLKPVSSVVYDWVKELQERDNGNIDGLSTGIQSLDKLIGVQKIKRGSLFVVGARPKMGKTTFLSKMVSHCAVNERKTTLVFSLEMSNTAILEKLIATNLGIDPEAFYRKKSMQGLGLMGRNEAGKLSDLNNIYIDDTPGIALPHIIAESRRIKREKGEIGLIAIDYLTLMQGEKAERNDLSYGLITKGLKALAKELDCVVLLLTQLNRHLESRADKRPHASDSRDTGQIEQDCDYWLGIYREHMYNEQADPTISELILRLNRYSSGVGSVLVQMDQGSIRDIHQNSINKIRSQHKKTLSITRDAF